MFSIFCGKKKYNPITKYKATMVVTVDEDTMGIGFEGAFPWRIMSPESTFSLETKSRNFNANKNKTPKDSIIICGHNTFYSNGYIPFENRNMIVFVTDIPKVITKMQLDVNEGIFVENRIYSHILKSGHRITFISDACDLSEALKLTSRAPITEPSDINIVVYGGKMMYEMFIDSDNLDVFVNRIIMFKIKSDKSNVKIVHSSPSFKKWCPKFDTFFYSSYDIKNRYRFKLVKRVLFENRVSMEIHDR